MSLLRFLGLLFAFVGVLASCTVVIALLVLLLRFWPVMFVSLLALAVFGWLMEHCGIRINTRD